MLGTNIANAQQNNLNTFDWLIGTWQMEEEDSVLTYNAKLFKENEFTMVNRSEIDTYSIVYKKIDKT